ncbi:hypothetical protein NQ317_014578, partial [Molorchus minor]
KNPKLCVVSTLIEYLKRTETYRETQEDDFLLMTIKSPHKTATTQTLSHSTRHASTSAASRAGVSFDQIMKTAGWTEKSLGFTEFDCRPLGEDCNEIATALLVAAAKNTYIKPNV